MPAFRMGRADGGPRQVIVHMKPVGRSTTQSGRGRVFLAARALRSGDGVKLARREIGLIILAVIIIGAITAALMMSDEGSETTQEKPSPTATDLMYLALVYLPITGLTLLLITVTPALFKYPPPPQPASRHVFSFIGAIVSVTLIGSLVDLVAFWSGSPSLMSYLSALVGTFLLYTFVSWRYLLKRGKFAAFVGGKFAVLNVISWFILILFTANHIAVTRRIFYQLLPLTLGVLIAALAYETWRFHIVTVRHPERPLPRGVRPPPRQDVPTTRIAELWVLVALSSVLVYIVSLKV